MWYVLRTLEVVLFLAGICLVGVPKPYQYLAAPCLFGWYFMWSSFACDRGAAWWAGKRAENGSPPVGK